MSLILNIGKYSCWHGGSYGANTIMEVLPVAHLIKLLHFYTFALSTPYQHLLAQQIGGYVNVAGSLGQSGAVHEIDVTILQ